MSKEFYIKTAIQNDIATLTLNRPSKLNAINDPMRLELTDALAALEHDVAIRGILLTGSGRGFCAGGDINGMKERLAAPFGDLAFDGWHRQQQIHNMQQMLYSLTKPVVAAVNGPAAGLGADLALACDFIIASEHATFSWAYIKRGLIPDGGGMYFLPRRVGLARAKELIFTGRTVDANEALQLGIIDRATNSDELMPSAHAWLTELSSGSRIALALTKTTINESFEQSLDRVFDQGSQSQGICYTSLEHRQAVEGFLSGSKTLSRT